MSPDAREPGPDDGRLVRPYMSTDAPSPHDHSPEPIAWPEPGPAPVPTPFSEPPAAPPAPSAPGGRRQEDRRSRTPLWAAGGAALLLGAGALALLPGDPEPESAFSSQRPDVSVPELRAPGTAPDPTPSATATRTASAGPSASPKAAGSSAPPAPSAAPDRPQTGDGGTLRMGDRGAEVTALQEALHAQGFTYVKVSGVYDGQTKRGVAQLQRDRDIKGDPSGVYGPATRAEFTI
ncbi:peptidoglycan-binding domain-containing protein [Streptomyces globosus]|uniref:peptidoglycan-binding domain-containing protein n=1 Tax=Streptomyces globosus TaxID=68209 RepID=UPI0031DA37DC